jgi:hypothetical protein
MKISSPVGAKCGKVFIGGRLLSANRFDISLLAELKIFGLLLATNIPLLTELNCNVIRTGMMLDSTKDTIDELIEAMDTAFETIEGNT